MYVSIYSETNKDQTLFKHTYDPRYVIKMIKRKDSYLSYIAYVQFNYIVNPGYDPEEVLSELLIRYSDRIEAYLLHWQVIAKGRNTGKYPSTGAGASVTTGKNYKKLRSIAEVMWKRSPTIKFDSQIS